MIRAEPFAFHNGRTARSAADLLQVLEEGPESLFTDHVTTHRNDFASWVKISLGEEALSGRLREATTRDATIAALRTWLSPHRARLSSAHHRKDFMIGFGLGIVVGILVTAVVAALN